MRGFQECWFGQGIPSKSNAKPLFGIHSLHKVTLFTMTCDVSEPVLMNVSAFATHQNTTAKSSLRNKYYGVGGTGDPQKHYSKPTDEATMRNSFLQRSTPLI